jgi:hypothetical protein
MSNHNYPIWDLGRHPSQINPDVFGLRISRPLDHPIWDLDSLQTPNYSRHVWTQDFQTVEEYSIWDLGRHPSQTNPDVFGLRSSKPLEYPIWDLGRHPSQIIPNVFGSKDPNSWISRFETWVVTQAKSIPTCLD